MPFFAVPGLRAQADTFRSGGHRRLALPDTGPDPTDGDALMAAFRARRRECSGELRLILAVVMAALEDLRRYPRGTKPHAEAVQWFVSDETRWPYAFRAVCTTLDLDADAVRTRVLAGLVRAA